MPAAWPCLAETACSSRLRGDQPGEAPTRGREWCQAPAARSPRAPAARPASKARERFWRHKPCAADAAIDTYVALPHAARSAPRVARFAASADWDRAEPRIAGRTRAGLREQALHGARPRRVTR